MPGRARRSINPSNAERGGAVFGHKGEQDPHRAAHLERAGLNAGRGYLRPDPATDTPTYPYLLWFTEWGITASGQPYLDLDGAAAGEKARLGRTGDLFWLDTNLDS